MWRTEDKNNNIRYIRMKTIKNYLRDKILLKPKTQLLLHQNYNQDFPILKSHWQIYKNSRWDSTTDWLLATNQLVLNQLKLEEKCHVRSIGVWNFTLTDIVLGELAL